MTEHPEGETRSDRVRAWILGLAAALVVLSLAAVLVLGLIIYVSGNNHHASAVRKDAEIVTLLTTVRTAQKQGHQTLANIQALQVEFNTLMPIILGLKPADAYLATLAKAFIDDINQLCSVTKGCTPIPVPPQL